jgi:hypothetical protein
MKEWRNPELWCLGAEKTEAGSNRTGKDGVVYTVPNIPPPNNCLDGKSGPPITTPGYEPKPPGY